MLYDPKWEKTAETKADPFKLGTLIAWLEKQPADKTYKYTDSRNCALCQYFSAMGFADPFISMNIMDHRYGRIIFPDILRAVAFPTNLNTAVDTFGAALQRAREAARFAV